MSQTAAKEPKQQLNLFSLTWPLFLENMLRMLLGNVNTMMLGRLSDQAVSAVGVSSQIVNLAMTLFSVISTGTAILVSQYLGAGQREKAAQSAFTALLLNAAFGVIASIVLCSCAVPLLQMMNLPDDLWPYAIPYLRIVGAAAIIQALASTCSALIRTYGYTKFSLYIAFLVNILNVIGGWLVVFRPFGLPSFGVQGIAVARTVSELAGLCCSLLFLRSCLAGWGVQLPGLQDVKKILTIGAPAAAEGLSYSVTQTLITSMIATLGSLALTTCIYVNNIVFYVYLLSMSMGSATQILAGRLAGLREPDSAHKLCMKNLRLAVCANCGMSILFMLLRMPLLRLYTSDPQILRVGSILLMLDLLIESGRAFNHIIPSALRGVGDVRTPVIIIICSMWVIGIPSCWLMGLQLGWGLVGVWLSMALEEWLRGLLMFFRWKSHKWEKMLLIESG